MYFKNFCTSVISRKHDSLAAEVMEPLVNMVPETISDLYMGYRANSKYYISRAAKLFVIYNNNVTKRLLIKINVTL